MIDGENSEEKTAMGSAERYQTGVKLSVEILWIGPWTGFIPWFYQGH